MKVKKNFKLCNFQLPVEICDYLQNVSSKEYMSMTQYVIQLIRKDKNKKTK